MFKEVQQNIFYYSLCYFLPFKLGGVDGAVNTAKERCRSVNLLIH